MSLALEVSFASLPLSVSTDCILGRLLFARIKVAKISKRPTANRAFRFSTPQYHSRGW